MKKYILIFVAWVVIMGIMYVGMFVIDGNKPVYIEYFKEGQILLPDMVCSDTLIVTNAERLNKDMALIEQGFIDPTDGEIDSVIHLSCIIKP